MATAINGKRDVIRFEPDQAVTVILKYPTGRAVSGTYGPQMMYTTTDERIFYLNPEIADSLEALKLRKGEAVRIAKVKRAGSNQCDWDIQRIPGSRENGASKNGADAKALGGNENGALATMADCFRAALDAIAEAQDYSNRKGIGIAFTSDNVTSAALSAYIAKTRETERAA